ncbi:RsmB/NOP family class I SAM-dependent RNA methyltransferase [Arenibacterium sp. CAU 1754]
MTPAARVQAAIEVLDDILSGTPAEKALTGWARRSRYAGSKDRAAVRDHVFGALRCKRSFAALGGGETGRLIMLGALRAEGQDPETLFIGPPYAPDPLNDEERAGGRAPEDGAEALDIPEWLWPAFCASLGDTAPDSARALQSRAPVHLRVNLLKTDLAAAQAALAGEGITCKPHPAASTALEVVEGARKIRNSRAYQTGMVELQDAASQAVIEALPLRPGLRVLDYCAGGGGKTLAIAAHGGVEVFAHDAAPQRMRDLPERARRAGANVTLLDTDQIAVAAPFDIVLIDVPCSGSGAWRRAPDGKWQLTQNRLDDLIGLQRSILDTASTLTAPSGLLAYATCSVLAAENGEQIQQFTKNHENYTAIWQQSWSVENGSDGFYAAHLTRVRNSSNTT